MSEQLHILRPDNPEWDIWLRRAPHDVYHLAAYHAHAQSLGEGEAEMLVYGTPDRFTAWPYLAREINAAHSDLTSAYGYTGPVGLGLEDAGFRLNAWNEFRNVWDDRQLVTLFSRFHPLLENAHLCKDFEGAVPTPGGEIIHLGRTVSINLENDRETRQSAYRRVVKQQIRRAKLHGMTFELDRDWRHLDRFIELYTATMMRNNAEGRYFFRRPYFRGLRQALKGFVHLGVAQLDGDVAAAMVFTVYNGIAQAHLAGVNANYKHLSPFKVVIDGVADLAKDLGANRYHIGAGRGGREDSLFRFKSLFAKAEHHFSVGRWILDAEAYAALSKSAPQDCASVFFPAYRTEAAKSAVA